MRIFPNVRSLALHADGHAVRVSIDGPSGARAEGGVRRAGRRSLTLRGAPVSSGAPSLRSREQAVQTQ